MLIKTDRPAIGTEPLHGCKTLNFVYPIQDHQGQDLANSGNGSEQVNSVGIMTTARLFDLPFQRSDQYVNASIMDKSASSSRKGKMTSNKASGSVLRF